MHAGALAVLGVSHERHCYGLHAEQHRAHTVEGSEGVDETGRSRL